MRRALCLLTILMLLVAGLAGCRAGSAPLAEPVTIRVAATRDFGRELIFDREAVIERRMSAQDVLAKVTEFATDGSYILEFEGLRGNDQVYWMYYINGMLSKWFASGYIIRPGDVMVWDFHPWAGAHHGASAIIGSFPEPLLHGYEGRTYPTTVVYGEGFQGQAQAVARGLQELGVNSVSVTGEAGLSQDQKGSHNLVLIADRSSGMVAELDAQHVPLGLYAHFEGGSLWVTNYRFENQQSYGAGSGVIQASQNLWNPLGTGSCQTVVFVVSGSDTLGTSRAVEALLDAMEAVKGGQDPSFVNAYGMVITADGQSVRTPL